MYCVSVCVCRAGVRGVQVHQSETGRQTQHDRGAGGAERMVENHSRQGRTAAGMNVRQNHETVGAAVTNEALAL